MEIRHRGFSKELKTWIYGYYVKCRNKHYILEERDERGFDERWSEWVEVYPDSIQQYIGIDLYYDPLFEGDILRVYTYYDKKEPALSEYTDHRIEYCGGRNYPAFELKPEIENCECNGISYIKGSNAIARVEVIGTFYQNKK